MSGQEVSPIITTPTREEWRAALVHAWWCTLPVAPVDDALALLWGQYAVETNAGRSCWNHNLGNIKHVAGGPGDYIWLRTRERLRDGSEVFIRDRFRAYPTLAEGALDYLRFLTRPSYAPVWERVVAGDAVGFIHQLKVHGYFTADEAAYARGELARVKTYWAGVTPHDPSKPEPGVQLGDDGPATPLGWADRAERDTLPEVWRPSRDDEDGKGNA